MKDRMLKINAGISVMPTRMEKVRRQRERVQTAIKAGDHRWYFKRVCQGSVSVSHVETSVTLRLLTSEGQIEAMLPLCQNLSFESAPVIT